MAYNNRGGTYVTLGEFDRAIADLNEAIKLKQDYAEAYCNRGNAYTKRDEFDKAIADLNEAIRLKANYPEGILQSR